MPTPTNRRPLRARLAATLTLAATFMLLGTGTAHAGDCKPSGIPDRYGSGVAGMIDPGTENPSEASLYGNYGWAGLRWDTCDLAPNGVVGSLPGADKFSDIYATLDTLAGNIFMGLAKWLGAAVTAVHRWNSDPGAVLAPFDEVLVSLSDFVQEMVTDRWMLSVLLVTGVALLVYAAKKQIRAFLSAVAWALGAITFLAFIGTYPLTIAQTMDGVANSITTESDQYALSIMNTAAAPDEALGTMLNDQVLWPLWAQGTTGSKDMTVPTPNVRGGDANWANQLFQESTVSRDESATDEDKLNAYDKVYQAVGDGDGGESVQKYVRGQGYNRTGMGGIALVQMALISAVRLPAEGLQFASVVIWRFIPIFGIIFALFGAFPATKKVALTGIKTIAAAAVNLVIFGVVAALHTAILGFITTRVDLGLAVLLSAIMTYVFWKLTKPVRSLSSMVNANSAHEGMGSMELNPWNKAMKLWSLANGTVQTNQARGLRRDLNGNQNHNGQDEQGNPTHPTPERYVDAPHPGPRYAPGYSPLQALPAGTATVPTQVAAEAPIVVHSTPAQRKVIPEDGPIVVHPTPAQREVTYDEPARASERDRQDAIQRADTSAEQATMRQLGRDIKAGLENANQSRSSSNTTQAVTGELVETPSPGIVQLRESSDKTYFHPPATTEHVSRIHNEVFIPPTATQQWNEVRYAEDTQHTPIEKGQIR